ncbi:hypothetical protein LUZ63_015195 [Rhynchospora breviuscula]|uniref:Receptor kinase-like protein Xa21 n=1 Tax=Rhynchospora breviuscula TaxID=2022672 RepID=A0A9Q0CC69_9POAL|nr:hypothetical protein LUZ63_015195 [Rhynchospora breviuscula]
MHPLYNASFFSLLASFLLLFSQCISAATNSPDRDTLLQLKSQLTDPLGALSSWNTKSLDICKWSGVVCSQDNQSHVIELDLISFGLSGSLSPYVANLTFLNRLNIANNFLSGHIPSELGLLHHLQYLNLSMNSFQGYIPSNLSSCTNLEVVSLSNNKLGGVIPPNLSQCKNLKVIALSDNAIEGGIPEGFGRHQNLTRIFFENNKLTGTIPEQLGTSSSLSVVNLANNSLTGEIPPFLANCSSLRALYLSYNKLNGEIPPTLFNNPNIAYIELMYNEFSGHIPPISLNTSPIAYLALSTNNLTGPIPPSLGKLTMLDTLLLANNYLEGTIPEELHVLNLKVLDLSINHLSGPIPHFVYNFSSLIYLGLGNNNFSGKLPQDIGYKLPNLQSLVMTSNKLEGSIPSSLANISGLQVLDLGGNAFSGMVPDLGTLVDLQELDLGWNQLEGNITTFLHSLTDCTNLVNLFLENNNLESILPQSIGKLSQNLQLMMIGGNKISGTIPAELGNLTSLNTLFMDRNLLADSIPPAIGNLTNLIILSLSTNNLSGPIPSSLGNLVQLNEIYLDANQLNGHIPESLGNCIHLYKANFSCNNLEGQIPKELVSITSFTQALDLSHNSLTGPIPLEVGKLNNVGVLNISHNNFYGYIPSSLGNCLLLEHLLMEGNFLEGSIRNSFSALKGLKEIDLSLNNLTGKIPDFFESFGSLSYLNLSFNNFDGPVPTSGIFRNETEVFIQGNEKLCSHDPNIFPEILPCPTQNSTRKSHPHLLRMVIIIVGISVILSLVVSLLLFFWKKAHRAHLSIDQAKEKYRKVSYADLERATDGFSPGNLVGSGRFGSVYKGNLEFQVNPVAIKVFNLDLRGGLKSFTTECDALRNLRHRNLVRVVTSCSTTNPVGDAFRALVFEYMPNGSLEEWLHPKSTGKALSLTQRISIASDVASALEYLHEECGHPIVHCDVKPSNILLDHAMTAHVSDFGIAEFLIRVTPKSKNSSSLSGLRGSIGYIAPEYGMGGKASTAGDVYSFGVLLLEMLTGKKPTDDIFKEGLSLPSFANEAFPERIIEIVDSAILRKEIDIESELPDQRTLKCLIQLIKVALLCTVELPKHRIKMRQVAAEIASIWQVFSN